LLYPSFIILARTFTYHGHSNLKAKKKRHFWIALQLTHSLEQMERISQFVVWFEESRAMPFYCFITTVARNVATCDDVWQFN